MSAPRIATTAAACLLIVASGCHKNDKADKLMALEKAYQSGVFSKQEYETKKAALLGSAPPPAAATPPAVIKQEPPPPATPPATETKAAPPPTVTPVHTPKAATTPPPPPPAPASEASPATETVKVEPKPVPPAPQGCTDAEARSHEEKGAQERFYPASLATVKKAAEAAFTDLDFTVHQNEGDEMEASKKRHIGALIGAGGERVVLHFQKSQHKGQAGILVTGETKKQKLVGRMSQKTWTTTVLDQIACHLKGR